MRVTCAVPSRKRRKRLLKQASGYRGNRSKLIRQAYISVDRAMAYAYIGRKQKKREYRALWIQRINAACRAADFKYSWLIDGLNKAGIVVNRKMLADMAALDDQAFAALIEKAKAARG
ncbi:MAG: 50S ribosomal protein L20 [Victivallales bacterium]|jgi:large subunit ribosomal protein L20|nr:50S ribosomal protein L20 [Victivallales bacterium]